MGNKKIIGYLLFTLALLSCNNSEHSVFRLPNGDSIKRGTIQELEKSKKIHYEQYRGFVFIYNNAFFKEGLFIGRNFDIVNSDVLNEKGINDLRSEKFDAIEFSYVPPDSSKRRDLQFENNVKKEYNDFDKENDLNNGFELIKKNEIYVKVEFYSFAIPNYKVTIYPCSI